MISTLSALQSWWTEGVIVFPVVVVVVVGVILCAGERERNEGEGEEEGVRGVEPHSG